MRTCSSGLFDPKLRVVVMPVLSLTVVMPLEPVLPLCDEAQMVPTLARPMTPLLKSWLVKACARHSWMPAAVSHGREESWSRKTKGLVVAVANRLPAAPCVSKMRI